MRAASHLAWASPERKGHRHAPHPASAILPVIAAVVDRDRPSTAVSTPAYAATLTTVSGFGSNPGNLTMYSYRPDGLPADAPLVVAMHGCTQNATDYFTNAGWRKYADLWKFALVLPEQKSANNSTSCFNWFEPGDTARGRRRGALHQADGRLRRRQLRIDPGRVYVTGLSAGGAMTAVMLATYPDVFAAGAIMAGLPYRCATSMTNAFSCMSPGVDKTPAAWGDLVRGAYSGYTGTLPARVDLARHLRHHGGPGERAPNCGTSGRTCSGVSQTPTSTRRCPAARPWPTTATRVKVYLVSGMTHGRRSTRAPPRSSAAPPARTTRTPSARRTTRRSTGA